MTAQELLPVLTSLVNILQAVSGWPFAIFFFIMIVGPWLFATALMYSFRKRFEAVVGMYESNVRLVEKYEKVAEDLQSVIIMNTQAMTRVCDRLPQGG